MKIWSEPYALDRLASESIARTPVSWCRDAPTLTARIASRPWPFPQRLALITRGLELWDEMAEGEWVSHDDPIFADGPGPDAEDHDHFTPAWFRCAEPIVRLLLAGFPRRPVDLDGDASLTWAERIVRYDDDHDVQDAASLRLAHAILARSRSTTALELCTIANDDPDLEVSLRLAEHPAASGALWMRLVFFMPFSSPEGIAEEQRLLACCGTQLRFWLDAGVTCDAAWTRIPPLTLLRALHRAPPSSRATVWARMQELAPAQALQLIGRGATGLLRPQTSRDLLARFLSHTTPDIRTEALAKLGRLRQPLGNPGRRRIQPRSTPGPVSYQSPRGARETA